MTLVLIGGSHHELSLSTLEILERDLPLLQKELFTAATAEQGIKGGVIISTCNRFELYLEVEKFHDGLDCALEVISKVSAIDLTQLRELLSVSFGRSLCQHLFSVAAGLESMIVGEAEIAGQVRKALKNAQEASTTTSELEQIFQRAAAVSKKVTTTTDLGLAGRSIVTGALDLVESRYGSLEGKPILLLGTGAYARVVVAALKKHKVGEIFVFSSSGRGKIFSESHGVASVAEEELPEIITRCQLIVACSGSKHYLLDASTFLARANFLAHSGKSEKLPIIDVALTSDLAPSVAELDFTDLIDLEIIGAHAPQEHAQTLLLAQTIVREAANEFEVEQLSRSIDPTIALMRAHVQQLISHEVERVTMKKGAVVAAEVGYSLNRVTNALLHTPSVRARSLTRTQNQEEYRRAIEVLFGIEAGGADGD